MRDDFILYVLLSFAMGWLVSWFRCKAKIQTLMSELQVAQTSVANLTKQIFEVQLESQKRAHEAEAIRLADLNSATRDCSERVKTESLIEFERGRALGNSEREKEHIEQMTRLYEEYTKKTRETVDIATTSAQERLRAEYELQTKLFSVKISPHVLVTEDNGMFSSSCRTEIGYQYQLLVNGIPAFQPHIVIECSEDRKEVNEESIKQLTNAAQQIASGAIDTYLGATGGAFVRLAQPIAAIARCRRP